MNLMGSKDIDREELYKNFNPDLPDFLALSEGLEENTYFSESLTVNDRYAVESVVNRPGSGKSCFD